MAIFFSFVSHDWLNMSIFHDLLLKTLSSCVFIRKQSGTSSLMLSWRGWGGKHVWREHWDSFWCHCLVVAWLWTTCSMVRWFLWVGRSPGWFSYNCPIWSGGGQRGGLGWCEGQKWRRGQPLWDRMAAVIASPGTEVELHLLPLPEQVHQAGDDGDDDGDDKDDEEEGDHAGDHQVQHLPRVSQSIWYVRSIRHSCQSGTICSELWICLLIVLHYVALLKGVPKLPHVHIHSIEIVPVLLGWLLTLLRKGPISIAGRRLPTRDNKPQLYRSNLERTFWESLQIFATTVPGQYESSWKDWEIGAGHLHSRLSLDILRDSRDLSEDEMESGTNLHSTKCLYQIAADISRSSVKGLLQVLASHILELIGFHERTWKALWMGREKNRMDTVYIVLLPFYKIFFNVNIAKKHCWAQVMLSNNSSGCLISNSAGQIRHMSFIL